MQRFFVSTDARWYFDPGSHGEDQNQHKPFDSQAVINAYVKNFQSHKCPASDPKYLLKNLGKWLVLQTFASLSPWILVERGMEVEGPHPVLQNLLDTGYRNQRQLQASWGSIFQHRSFCMWHWLWRNTQGGVDQRDHEPSASGTRGRIGWAIQSMNPSEDARGKRHKTMTLWMQRFLYIYLTDGSRWYFRSSSHFGPKSAHPLHVGSEAHAWWVQLLQPKQVTC